MVFNLIRLKNKLIRNICRPLVYVENVHGSNVMQFRLLFLEKCKHNLHYNGEWTFPLFILYLCPAPVKSLDVRITLNSKA